MTWFGPWFIDTPKGKSYGWLWLIAILSGGEVSRSSFLGQFRPCGEIYMAHFDFER